MGQTTKTSTAASQVQDMIAPWTQACLERDWDALLAMCNDDIVFMPPGAGPVTGAAVRPWLEAFPAVKAMSWTISHIEEEGDLAWLHGPVRQTFDIDGKEERFAGKYADVMRRGADGRWRFSMVIWNSNEA